MKNNFDDKSSSEILEKALELFWKKLIDENVNISLKDQKNINHEFFGKIFNYLAKFEK